MQRTHQTIYLLICIGLALLCTSCAEVAPPVTASSDDGIFGKPLPYSANYYLKRARESRSPQREENQLIAAQALLQNRNYVKAQELLNSITSRDLPERLKARKALLSARLKLVHNNTRQALSTLNAIAKRDAKAKSTREFIGLMASAYTRSGNYVASVVERVKLSRLLENDSAKQRNNLAIWQNLQKLSATQLRRIVNSRRFSGNRNLRAWFELAYLAETYSDDEQALAREVRAWKQQHPKHAANSLISDDLIHAEQSLAHERKIILLLPLHGKLAEAGKAIKNGFMNAFYNDKGKHRQPTKVEVIDTSRTRDLLQAYRKLANDDPSFVIGPLKRDNVDKLLIEGDLSAPTLALNYSRSPYASHPHFFQFGLSPLDEAQQAAEFAWESGRTRAIIIAPKGQWGEDVADAFESSFHSAGGNVVDRFVYDSKTDLSKDIKHLLKVDDSQARAQVLQKDLAEKVHFTPHRREDFNMVFLVANPRMARQILPMLKFYYAGDVPVYATSTIYSGLSISSENRDLNGVYFCDIPWVLDSSQNSEETRNKLAKLWPGNYNQYIRLYALGMDAYRLSRMPNRLTAFPQFNLKGATGALTMDSKHRIHRHLQWVQMRRGKPVPLS